MELMELKPISSRLMKVRMRGKHINTTIIQCYTPTNDSDEEAKDVFYEQLQGELEGSSWHNLKIIIGDLNAKVMSDKTNHNRAMGREGCGSVNDHGKQLLELCISSSHFRNSLPTPSHTQANLVFPQRKRQPDRPPDD